MQMFLGEQLGILSLPFQFTLATGGKVMIWFFSLGKEGHQNWGLEFAERDGLVQWAGSQDLPDRRGIYQRVNNALFQNQYIVCLGLEEIADERQ
jgi:hypothetical protein